MRNSDPTPVVRMTVSRRDGHRCLVCGYTELLEFQHRQATGMGGRGRGHRPSVVEGLTACTICNGAFEHSLQQKALLNGWKVKRWIPDCALVPVFYPLAGGWHVLTAEGGRELITPTAAHALMLDAYGEQYERWEKAA